MANWASTSYRIEGNEKDLQELINLYKAFQSKERPPMEENASEGWEGNIILALGIEIQKGQYIRGFIQDCHLDDNVLYIEAEEAWGATDFRHILEDHYQDMKVYYVVEEEGDEVYATNDDQGKYFDFNFLLDMYTEEDGDAWEYFNTKEQALAFIADKLHVEKISEEDIEKWNEEHEGEDAFIYLHEFQYVA